jgi:ubiquinone/menaquinone biosynthesis C-methylase UbiE
MDERDKNRLANVNKYLISEERNKFSNQPGKIVKLDFFRRHCHDYVQRNEKILDIGGGSGLWTDILRDKGITDNIYALDLNQSVLAERNKLDISSVGDMEKLPYGDNFFDRAMFFASLHHVRDTKKALSEAQRVVKRDGYIFLNEPVSVRLLFSGKSLKPTADNVEFSFSLVYLIRNIKAIDGQITYMYFDGFFKRFFIKFKKLTLLKAAASVEELINKIPVLRLIFGVFSNYVIILFKKSH